VSVTARAYQGPEDLEAETTKVLINMALAQQAGLDLEPVILGTLEQVR
jgi:hypothetical protein